MIPIDVQVKRSKVMVKDQAYSHILFRGRRAYINVTNITCSIKILTITSMFYGKQSTVKHLLFARTLFSRKFARP